MKRKSLKGIRRWETLPSWCRCERKRNTASGRNVAGRIPDRDAILGSIKDLLRHARKRSRWSKPVEPVQTNERLQKALALKLFEDQKDTIRRIQANPRAHV
jgi:hypothetical protein